MSISRQDAIELGERWEGEMRRTATTMDAQGLVEIAEGNRKVADALSTLLRFVRKPATEPKIVTLCGSSRFCQIMAVIAWWLERDEGKIAMGLHLLPDWYPDVPGDHLAEHEGVAAQMDALHLAKIDMADEVFIVNWNEYVGTSTRNEIQHALNRGKTMRWLMQPPPDFAKALGVVDATMYDRVATALDRAKREQDDESARVLTSDGEDRG